MQRLLATTMMLLMMTAALAGCAGDDSGFTQEDIDAAREEGRAAGIAEATTPSTLDVIIDRGSMKCGVKESQYGMGYLDSATGVRSGLDISYCRAVAAALGLNPDTDVEYIPASGSDRFEKLASGTIDVLIRTTTWTTSRDADLNADFAGMNFFDGQGILVRGDRYDAATAGNSAAGLNGANICVGIGTTTEGNMQDWFSSRSIDFTSVPVADAAEATQKFRDGECDAFTGDMSAMVAKKLQLDNDDTWTDAPAEGIWIAPLNPGEIGELSHVGNSISILFNQSSEEYISVISIFVSTELFGTCNSNYSGDCSNFSITSTNRGLNIEELTTGITATCSHGVDNSFSSSDDDYWYEGNSLVLFESYMVPGLDCVYYLHYELVFSTAGLGEYGYESYHDLSWGEWVYSIVWESVPIEQEN